MTTLRDAIRAATNDTTITTPKIQKDVQGNVSVVWPLACLPTKETLSWNLSENDG